MKKPSVSIRVNDSESFPAFVDTGSDYTIVPRNVVKGGITNTDPLEEIGFMGKRRMVQKRKLRITVGDRFEEIIEARVFVDPRDEIAVVGTDFLQKRDCKVSLQKGNHHIQCKGGAGKRAGKVIMMSMSEK